MFDIDFWEKQRAWLCARLESKEAILKEGGERALSHSLDDLIRIDFALKRLDEGQYGLCTNCGAFIEKERLDIIPETPFCADCAKSIEAQ
jgi:RNA polymerase-binding transcription factor DksA